MKADQERKCSKCNVLYPLTDEYFSVREDKGVKRYRRNCRLCAKQHRKKYYEDNKEDVLMKGRIWKQNNKERRRDTHKTYYENNREAILEKCREYYHNTKDKTRERKRQYRIANREHRNKRRKERYLLNKEKEKTNQKEWYVQNKTKHYENGQKWRANNKEKTSQHRSKRRALVNGSKVHYTAKDVTRVYHHHRGRCFYCGEKISKNYHIEHIIPLSRGGSNGCGNITIACIVCNSKKGQKYIMEWKLQNKRIAPAHSGDGAISWIHVQDCN